MQQLGVFLPWIPRAPLLWLESPLQNARGNLIAIMIVLKAGPVVGLQTDPRGSLWSECVS